MIYRKTYESPFETIYLESDGKYLTGLWFRDSRDSKKHESIIISCHRVIGSNNSLVGYGGGIKNKIKLLEIEKMT